MLRFECPMCSAKYEVQERTTRCKGCGSVGRTVGTESPQSGQFNWSLVLLLLGGLLLAAAICVNQVLDSNDQLQSKSDEAAFRLRAALGDYKWSSGAKSDRTWVYVLVILGGVSIVTGLGTLANRRPLRPESPHTPD
jgi:hypothetical protein